MAKIISFMNQKGGTGKTTSCLNVGACLSQQGYKVLLVDLDPQGHLTIHSGISLQPENMSIYEVLTDKANIKEAILKSDLFSFDLLPSDIRLSGVDLELSSMIKREEILKRKLKDVKGDYDFILIDNPPTLSLITLNSMTASNSVVIPVQAQYLAYHGLKKLIESIEVVKSSELNPELFISGVFVTMYDPRRNLDITVLNELNKLLPEKIYKTQINNNVSLAEASANGQDIFNYKNNSVGAQQYREVTKEILATI